jgi:DNA-binding transcriptional MerR regulator
VRIKSRNSVLRTVDVSRRVGCSVQQVRNLERDGVLPPAERSPSGYRSYDETHVRCGVAYRHLAAGVGPAEAKKLLRAARTEPTNHFLELLDEAHAHLHAQRRDLDLARRAVNIISTEPLTPQRPSDSMTISEIAGALGVPPTTLRHWEAEALLAPQRDRHGARSYPPATVRDARIVHQLRLAGYDIPRLRAVMTQLRRLGRLDNLEDALAERQRTITARSRSLLRAAASLSVVVEDASPSSETVPR